MKKLQTSIRGGIEDVLFPMEVLNITQGDNEGTHLGTYAIDNAGKDTGIDPIFAPCTMRIMDKWNQAAGNDIFFQSVNKVRFADGSIDYLTCRFIHDDYTGDIELGRVFVQGEEFSDEGSAGKAFGNHAHMEFGKGAYYRERASVQNAQGTWHLENNMPVEQVCFMDGTLIQNGVADWKYLADVAASTCPFTNGGVVTALNVVNVRTSPNVSEGYTGIVYDEGMTLYYDSIVESDGFYWAEYSRSVGGKGYCALCKADGTEVYWTQV